MSNFFLLVRSLTFPYSDVLLIAKKEKAAVMFPVFLNLMQHNSSLFVLGKLLISLNIINI